jgi:hypothetical protein
MPKKSPHPHVVWRDGRPRFQPGPALRAQGHTGHDLRHPDGRWLSKGEAVDWSIAFQKKLKAQLATASRPSAAPPEGQPAKPAVRPVRPNKPEQFRYTVAKLFEDWRSPVTGSPKFRPDNPRRYSPHTIRFYATGARVIERDHIVIWNAAVEFLRPGDLVAMHEEIWASRGLATARATILTLSAAISWAIRRSKLRRNDNPAKGLAMEVPAPRLRIASREEFTALVAAADKLGRPEIGDMCHLGVWTGQRQADRLALVEQGLLKNRRVFRQAKTGAIVAIRDTPALKARLKAAEARRAGPRAEALLAARATERAEIERRFARVILDEQTWRPFGEFHFRKQFQKVRAEAAKTCPTVADFHDADFRDTAVTWMANGGATIPEICAVTGHTFESATRILRHYLALNPEMADTAIGKMLAWYEEG